MATILGANTLSSAYDVANGVKFEDGDNAKMSRSISASPTDPEKYTFSCWIKRGNLIEGVILGNYANANFRAKFGFDSNHKLEYYQVNDGSASASVVTTQVFRDTTAWYHIVLTYDSSQGTAADRVKFYVNGTVVSSYSGTSYPAQDLDSRLNQASQTLVIGQDGNDSKDFDGYMCELVLIDGQALDATSFGEFDSDTPTTWKPKDPSSLTFGDDGFYLDFEDSGDLGDDESGNGNDFTEVNLDAADQTPDTCTNNFATLNPLGFAGTTPTFSQGNLNALCGSGVSLYSVPTIGVSSGKWYVEGELEQASITGGAYYVDYGFHDRANTRGQSYYVSNGRMFWLSSWDGKINYRTGGSTTAGLVTGLATLTPGDFFQLYLDMDNELMYWGKNGSLLNSTGVSFNGKESLTGEYFFAFGDQFTSGTHEYAVNFGQGSIDGSAVANFQDANGFGNFKYNPTVTTDEGSKDFLALCTKNLGSDGG